MIALQASPIRNRVAIQSSAYYQTILPQILVDFAKRLEQGGLMVGNSVRCAISSHYFLNLAQFIGRHSRKQVVLDLAGQAAGGVVDAGMLLDVPAGQHLFAEEIHGFGAIEQRHSLMVRSEDQRQIQS